jgi:hypothetical protein
VATGHAISCSICVLAAVVAGCSASPSGSPVAWAPAATSGLLYMQFFENECGMAANHAYTVWEAPETAGREGPWFRPSVRHMRWHGTTDATGTLRIDRVPSGDY